jgi:hypothetical protein
VAALIDRYLAALERELSFDPALARRLRYEVEDHLEQAIAAGGPDAERRAIERFGEPRDIAARFAPSSLRKQRKALGLGVMAAIAGIFLAMKIRVAAAGLAGNALAHGSGLAAVLAVDRYAFWFAAIAGVLGCLHAIRAPAAQRLALRRWVTRSSILASSSAAGLVGSVAADLVLTMARIVAGTGQRLVVPLVSVGAEVALAAVLIACVAEAMRRSAISSVLLGWAAGGGKS